MRKMDVAQLKMERNLDRWHKLMTKAQPKETGADWQVGEDGHAELNLHLQGIEDGSLVARLSDDGQSIKLSGKSCQDTSLKVTLPFGPANADDVELTEFPDGKLTVRTVRKPAAPPELKIIKASPAPDERAPEEQAQLTATRENEEKELERKFKIAIDGVTKQMAIINTLASTDGEVTGESQKEGQPEEKTMPPRDEHPTQDQQASTE